MLPVIIEDGRGNGSTLKINGEGEIGVVMHSHPPRDEEVESFPYSQYFVNSGSNDMTVDGSTTPVEFSIDAHSDRDIWIKSISIFISDNGARLNLFGAIAALTNGVSFTFKNNSLGRVIIQDEIQTNLDFIRLCSSTQGVGSGTSAFRADVSGSGADSYLPVLDIEKTFGFPWGIRLKKGTQDKISFFVNDNVSALDTFNIQGFGTQL